MERRGKQSSEPLRVVIVIFPGFQTLDALGPLEVFATAGELAARTGAAAANGSAYRVELWAERVGPVGAWTGVEFVAQRAYPRARVPVDTLLLAGGGQLGQPGVRSARGLLRFLRRSAGQVRRIGSVCTGAFALAEAGLLRGRRATTHWRFAAELSRRHPDVAVEPDALFVRDGNVYTSAGVSAGMDLALALVEEDLGRSVALATARELVLFLKRPGGQSQFSAELRAQERAAGPLAELPQWLGEHLDQDLSVPALGRQTAMSERNFARVFRATFGEPPARFVERMRVGRARRLLEDGELRLDEVAVAAGFGNAERMRKSFQRQLDVVPRDYRQRFAGAPPPRANRRSG